jgi:phosphonate transport system substrate-binding protein
MKSKSLFITLTFLVVALLLGGCDVLGGGVDTEAIGTEAHPIKVMFVPSHDAESLLAGGDVLADVLHEATGYYFDVSVPSSYISTLEEMCASPYDTMGFIPGLGYTLANQMCGVEVVAKAERYGYPWYAAAFLVLRDSGYDSLEDLAGKKWASPGPASTSGFLYPTYQLNEAGVTPGETVFFGGDHPPALTALYNGEVDFATGYYSPAKIDGVTIADWVPGHPQTDVPEESVANCVLLEDGSNLDCDGFSPQDVRRAVRKTFPDILQKVKVLEVTPQITNDTMSFGPDFPEEQKQAIIDAMFAFAESDPDNFAVAFDPYSWTNILPAVDADYDDIRDSVEATGFELEDLASE